MECLRVAYKKKEAKALLRRNKKHPKQYRKEKRMYYCERCNAWHLTAAEYVSTEEYQATVFLKFFFKWTKLYKHGKATSE